MSELADALDTDSRSPLRRALEEAIANEGGSMKDYTVLDVSNDPFRVDTPARHRDGGWLATTAQDLGLGDRRIHLRGLHYMVIGRPKPDGTSYTNTDEDWAWLSTDAVKAARWLGYLPFEQIVDQRNSPPVVQIFERYKPWPYINVGINVEISGDVEPRVGIASWEGTQPYKLVIFGEKSSLGDVLAPIANNHEADLYLPTGEVSDTLIHTMAKIGAEDGRPMVVLYFSDCDPAGWQMSISVARKLQAFKTLLFPDLEFEMHRVALTPAQVRQYDLPITPLKESERRGDKWKEAYGVEQTEIDALASLRPDLLRRIARDAITPFYDRTLHSRSYKAQEDWRREAQAIVDDNLDPDLQAQLRTEANEKLVSMKAAIDEINDQLRIDADDFDLPEIVIPEAELDGDQPEPLFDSQWSFAEQCQALIDSKAYRT